ncbi:30S ribosomal protein S3 [Lutibacter sp. B2]|nr:30S ribosomal protein S3 [Lutibacter sp. B2]
MGQKVNPHGLRVGIIKDWDSKWYADKKNFADLLIEDDKIRKFVKQKLYTSGISKIVIERAAKDKVKVNVFTAKPGMVIGKGGSGVETLKKDIEKITNKNVLVNVNEIRRAEMEAQLVAENVAFSLERRVSFRRAMKQAMQRTMKTGVKGIKVQTSGRLGGAEMARSEKYSEGNVPLHTLRADIDYGFAEANTTYGKIGVKVWINKGEVLPNATEEVKEQRRNTRNKDFKPRSDNKYNRKDNTRQDYK